MLQRYKNKPETLVGYAWENLVLNPLAAPSLNIIRYLNYVTSCWFESYQASVIVIETLPNCLVPHRVKGMHSYKSKI